MTETELFINIYKCAVTARKPQTDEPPDLDRLWDFANKHSIIAAVASVLLENGLVTGGEELARWQEAEFKCIRKTHLFDAERRSVCAALEALGVRCAPLKGIVLSGLYPYYGTRDFSDNDIFISGGTGEDVANAMKALGYERREGRMDIHYSFCKPPLFHFELHFQLFSGRKEALRPLHAYFESIAERLVDEPCGGCEWSLSNEDSYLFILAHAYKHYTESGVGLRTLADVYLYRRKVPTDRAAVESGLRAMGIEKFAEETENLADRIFGCDGEFSFSSLTARERELLEEMAEMGTFGTWKGYYSRRYREYAARGSGSRLGYYKKRFFPSMEDYREKHPLVYKHKALRPAFYVYRPIRGLFVNGKKLRCEFKAVNSERRKRRKG